MGNNFFLLILFFTILFLLIVKILKKNRKNKERLDFNKKYTNQFRILGNKKYKKSNDFIKLYKKMNQEKKLKNSN